MNLGRHFSVIWRFKGVIAGGVTLGIILGILAAFHVPSMTRRGVETWQTQSDILVTQRGFPWGRVTLPQQAVSPAAAQAGATGGDTGTGTQGSGLTFADPGRFSSLALLYSLIAYSDQVRGLLPEHPTRDQIQAAAVDATGNGTSFLPVIRLTTKGSSSAGAIKLNAAAFGAFQKLLRQQQNDSHISDNQRVQLSVINKPDHPQLLSGPSKTPSILAFMLCLIGAIAVAHMLDSLRPRRNDFGGVGEEPQDDYPAMPLAQPTVVAVPSNGSWTSGPPSSAPHAGQRMSS
jgi:hypothetical protein